MICSSFFQHLKKTAGDIEKQVAHLETAVETKESDSTQAEGIKTLKDIELELKEIVVSAEREIKRSTKESNFLSELTSLTDSFLKKQQDDVNKTRDYLMKYGYVPKGEDSTEEQPQKETDGDSDKETETQPPPPSPPKANSHIRKMPRLEEAGISQAGLKSLNNILHGTTKAPSQQPRKSPCRDPVVNERRSGPITPAIFQHRGILVSPSFFSKPRMGGTEDRHYELASPFVTLEQGPSFMADQNDILKSQLTFEDEDTWTPATTSIKDLDMSTQQSQKYDDTKLLKGPPAPPKLLSDTLKLGCSPPVMHKTFCKDEPVSKKMKTTLEEPKAPLFHQSSDLINRLTPSDPTTRAPKMLSETKASTPPVPESMSQRLNILYKEDNSATKPTISGAVRSEMPVMPSFLNKYVNQVKENDPPK